MDSDAKIPTDDTDAAITGITALYLAHLNPVTNAHVEIISDLKRQAQRVKVMPVVFKGEDGLEVNSRSFPFSFESRRDMLTSVFGDSVVISDDYTFYAPFRRYMPPILSPMSWRLRRQILRGISGRYFSYTGDKTEGYMLRLYMLKPRVGRRKSLSAASVKERLYSAALDMTVHDVLKGDAVCDEESDVDVAIDANEPWESDVPPSVASVIKTNWDTVQRFAKAEDMTVRIMGMKFPKGV